MADPDINQQSPDVRPTAQVRSSATGIIRRVGKQRGRVRGQSSWSPADQGKNQAEANAWQAHMSVRRSGRIMSLWLRSGSDGRWPPARASAVSRAWARSGGARSSLRHRRGVRPFDEREIAAQALPFGAKVVSPQFGFRRRRGPSQPLGSQTPETRQRRATVRSSARLSTPSNALTDRVDPLGGPRGRRRSGQGLIKAGKGCATRPVRAADHMTLRRAKAVKTVTPCRAIRSWWREPEKR